MEGKKKEEWMNGWTNQSGKQMNQRSFLKKSYKNVNV